MIKKIPAVVAALLLALGMAGSARAEVGPYIGLSAGLAQVEVEPGDIGGVGFTFDQDDNSFRGFFGLELPGPLSVEVGYRDLGLVTDRDGLVQVTSESDGIDAFAIGALPIGPVKLFAKGGVIAWDSKLETRRTGGVGPPDVRFEDDGTDFAWGLGVQFEIRKFAFRGEYEQLELDIPDEISVISVGVAYKF